ncbi:MAG: tetratricopeptide repeat protein [Candidatus Sumerlaeota bacterium]|nr:tetratricopeptide repeat protein [Candidatus Sumerlaeota bacterium]
MRIHRVFSACVLAALLAAALGCSARTSEYYAQKKRSNALNLIEQAEKHSNEGVYQQAIDCYLKALDLAPSPQIYYGLGHCYSRMQEYDTAEVYLQKAVDAAPDFKLAYYELLHAQDMMNVAGGNSTSPVTAGPASLEIASVAPTPEARNSPEARGETARGQGDATATPPAHTMDIAAGGEFQPRPLKPPPAGAAVQTVRSAPKPAAAPQPSPPSAVARAVRTPVVTPAKRTPVAAKADEILLPPTASTPAPTPAPTPNVPAGFRAILPPAGIAATPAPTPPAAAVLPSAQERPTEKGAALSRVTEILFGGGQQKPGEKKAAPPRLPTEEVGTTVLDDAQFHVDKAEDYIRRNEPLKAIDEYIEALKLNDKDATARARLAGAYLAVGKRDKAEEQIRRALELDPNNFEATFRMAEMAFNAGRADEAQSLAEKAVALNGQDADAQILLGDVSAKMGREERAEELYQRAHQLLPESARPYWKLGNLRLQGKDYPRAREYYDKALELDPKFSPVYNNLGILAQAESNFQEAERDFKKAIELDPRFTKAYKNLGILYESHMNKPKDAVRYYQKYIELGGEDSAEVQGWVAQIRAKP